MEEDLVLRIGINSKIDAVIKNAYEEYLEKADEPVLSAEEFNLHLFKLGILSNEIKKHEIKLESKKEELSEVKSELASLEREFRNNRIKIKTAYSFECIH